MPTYGDVLYNLQGLWIASLDISDDTYGTPVFAEIVTKFSYEFDVAEDELMAYGLIVDVLAIVKKATGSIQFGSMDYPVFAIITGQTANTSGTTPNEVRDLDLQIGTDNSYFGAWAQFQSTKGTAVVGLPKCKLTGPPPFTIEENAFRRGEVTMKMLAPSTLKKRLFRLRTFETVSDFVAPTNGTEFKALWGTDFHDN